MTAKCQKSRGVVSLSGKKEENYKKNTGNKTDAN